MKNVLKNLSVAAALLMGLTANAQHSYTGVTSGMTYYECADYISNSFTVTLPAGAVTSNWVIDNTYSIALGTTNYAGNNFHIYSTTTNSIQFTATDLNQHEIAVEYKVGTTSGQVFFYVDAYTTQISGPTAFCNTAGATYTEGGSAPTKCPGTPIWTSSNSAIPINSSTGVITGAPSVGGGTSTITLALAGVCPSNSPSSTASLAVTSVAGVPANPVITETTVVGDACPNYHYACTATATNATEFVWSVSNTTDFSVTATGNEPGYGTANLNIKAGYSEITTLTVQAENLCGFSAGKLSVNLESWSETKCGGALKNAIKNGDGETDNTFKIYPNPAQNIVNIEYAASAYSSSDVNVDVYDMLGKKVTTWTLSGNTTTATEDVSALPKGLYIYTVTSGNNLLERGKLMIQH